MFPEARVDLTLAELDGLRSAFAVEAWLRNRFRSSPLTKLQAQQWKEQLEAMKASRSEFRKV